MVKEVEELGPKLQSSVSRRASVFFMIEKSVLLNPGPMTTLRPRLPKRADRREYRSIEPTIDAADDVDWSGHIGPQRVRHASDCAVAGDDVDWVAALRLKNRGKLPAVEEPVAAKWQFIDCADDDAVARVEIRKTTIAAQVIAVLHNDALRTEGIVVERLRPGVGSVDTAGLADTAVFADTHSAL